MFCAIVLSAFSASVSFAQARAYSTEPSLSPDRKGRRWKLDHLTMTLRELSGSPTRMKITANDGANIERNPRPVDIEVMRPIGETLRDRDSQLDVAIRELLKQPSTSRSTPK
jgi:hypothetical protein